MILEILTGCIKAFICMVIFYYTERLLIKISKGKRHIGQTPGETKCKPLCVSSHWSHVGTQFSHQRYMITCEKCYQPGMFTEVLVFRVYWGSVTKECTTCLIDLSYSDSTLPTQCPNTAAKKGIHRKSHYQNELI